MVDTTSVVEEGTKGSQDSKTEPAEAPSVPNAEVLDEKALAEFLLEEDEVEPPRGDEAVEPPRGEPPQPQADAIPPPQVQATSQAAPQAAPQTMPQADVDYSSLKERVMEELAQRRFNLTPEVAEQFDAEPSKHLPKLLARTYLEAVEAAMSTVLSQLPTMVEQVRATRDAASEFEKRFFEAHPALKRDDPEHYATATRIGMAYRQMHPNASVDEFIRDVGASTIVALRLAGAEGSKHPPAKPLASSAPRQVGHKPKERNPYEVLAEEFLEEDSS